MISKERLLEVAREVFLELGIRATTLEVAMRAGVAEGTIFHRFKSKDELFWAAMRFDPEEGLAFVERLPGLAGPESELCGAREGDRSERLRRVVGAISAFFEAEMEAGRLGRGNPQVLARMLLGSLHHFCISEYVAREAVGLSPREFAREVVDVLLAGDAGRQLPAARGVTGRRER